MNNKKDLKITIQAGDTTFDLSIPAKSPKAVYRAYEDLFLKVRKDIIDTHVAITKLRR
jgi:hypothetical protein